MRDLSVVVSGPSLSVGALGPRSLGAALGVLVILVSSCGDADRPPPIGDYSPHDRDSGVDLGEGGSGGTEASGGAPADGGRSSSTGGELSSGGGAGRGGAGGASAGGAAGMAGSGEPDGGAVGGTGGGPDGGTLVACDRGVFSGDVDLYRQGQVAVYEGYTEINGYLYIGTNFANPTNTVTDLEALHCLERVDSLTLIETPLPSLAGLESLRTVGLVDITNSPNLTSLDGFDQLTITGDLRLGVNETLTDLGPDTAILSVAGDITEWQNPSLDPCLVSDLATRVGATCACTPATSCP